MVLENIRILITDDIPQVRQGLKTMLELATKNAQPHIRVVGEARDGRESIQQAQLLHPDVILMDLEMPVLDGFHATQSIKSQDPSIFILILSIHSDLVSRQRAIQAGADAFFEKSAPLGGLVQAIQSLHKVNLEQEVI